MADTWAVWETASATIYLSTAQRITLQTRDKFPTFGAYNDDKPSKCETDSPHLECQTTSSHYKRSLTKLALEVHWTSNLSEFPLRVAFARAVLRSSRPSRQREKSCARLE
ncbi:hypothetical protein BVL65_01840 [Gardnerella swidsinskii]|uniref:Uncharacterized protein n=1 Tax=Gardnerella swidsinskii TaxID=2792979 RepID=A0ABM6GI30_9BIFI|nr:hypothetical protein BVL65_01840 [Gardnerella vaginalis]